MTEVLLKYRPIGFLPWQRKYQRQIPDTWHELTQAQFMHVSYYFENPLGDLASKIIMLKGCLDVPRKAFYAHDYWQIHKLLELFSWAETIAFNKVFIRSFKIDRIEFYGPKDGFENLTFDEFIVADTYFSRFLQSKSIGDLHRIVYALYRPLTSNNSRELLDEFDLDKYSAHIKKLDEHFISAIVFNYRVIRRWIEQSYPLIFPENAEQKEKPTKQQTPSTPQWTRLRSELAGGQIADIPRIGRLPLHTVLYDISNRIKKAAS